MTSRSRQLEAVPQAGCWVGTPAQPLTAVGWGSCASVSSSIKGGGDVPCLSDEWTGHAGKPSKLEEEELGHQQ